jgi:hypothetical protein
LSASQTNVSAAVDAETPEHYVMSCDPVADFPGHAVDRPLETLVLPGLDLAAVGADDVVMVIAARQRRFVACSLITDVDALDEFELREQVEDAVHARDTDGPPRSPRLLMDLLRRETAPLAAEQLDNGGPSSAATEAGVAEDGEGVLRPRHDS